MATVQYLFTKKRFMATSANSGAGADRGFLKRGFICIKVLGVHYADFISFFLNTENEIIWSQ